MKPIYLDHNATTPLHPEVLEAMLPTLKDHFGNPSSVHSHGRSARVLLDEAREKVASLIHCHPTEIVFTGSGTEANNLAIKGVAWALREKGNHIITCAVEHASVSNPCGDLIAQGFRVEIIPVDSLGRIDLENLKNAITDQTTLITIQHANNEVGTLQDISAIGNLAGERGILFHTDAIQSAGKISLDLAKLPVDLMSLSAHKLQGPKGVGALFIRKKTPPLASLVSGGGQEKKRRAGTENVSGIIGFGKAADLVKSKMETVGTEYLDSLRKHLLRNLKSIAPEMEVFGDQEHRLPNTLGVCFPGISGETLLIALDMEGISVSTGSACSSGALSPSPVLQAMGIPDDKINSSLRVSLGWNNTQEEMDAVSGVFQKILPKLKEKTPVFTSGS